MRRLRTAAARLGGRVLAAVLLAGIVALGSGPRTAVAALNSWSSGGPYDNNFLAVAVDPQTPTTLYAGLETGSLLKSVNGGATWTAILDFATVQAIVIDPLNPRTLYVGTRGGYVMKSTDGGAIFQQVRQGLGGASNVRALAIDPQTPSTLFAGTADGVFKTIDGGASWGNFNGGLGNTDVRALAIDPQFPTVRYAGTAGGVYKIDGEAAWGAANSGLGNLDVRALAIHPGANATSATLFAGTAGGVYKSSNSAGSWVLFNGGLGSLDVRALAIDPQSPTTRYAGTAAGVYRIIGDVAWASFSSGLSSADVRALAIRRGPGDPSATVFAGQAGDRGAISRRVGDANWETIATNLVRHQVYALAVSPQASSTLYAGAGVGAYRSQDGGATWFSINNELPRTATRLVVDPQNPNTIYAATSLGVFRTTNGGQSWAAFNDDLPPPNGGFLVVNWLGIDPQTPSTLYAVVNGGVYKRTTGGSWQARNNGLPPVNPLFGGSAFGLAIDPQTPATLYATTGNGVYKSTSGADTWQSFSSGLEGRAVFALAVNPSAPNELFVGTFVRADFSDPRLFRSVDGGASWTPTDLSGQFVGAVAIDPLIRSTIYVASQSGPDTGDVFRSTDGGASWQAFNAGLQSQAGKALAIDPRAPARVHLGTSVGAFSIEQSVDVGVTVSGAPNPVAPGADLTLTYDVRNSATVTAGTVELNAPVPNGTTFRSISAPGWTCGNPAVGGTGTVRCTLPLLGSAPAQITVVVRPTAAGTVTATATVSSAGTDSNAGNNSANSGPIAVETRSTLTVDKAGAGTGTVSSSPPGIACGNDCSEPYVDGTLVTLTATPTAGSVFAGWSGGGCGGTGQCQVTVNAATTVTATFTRRFELTVSLAGSGTGSVSSSPAGIACGADCSESYLDGTAVTLTATPAAGSLFAGFSGACSGSGPCTVTMDAARSVSASFTQTFGLTVTRQGSGSGSVASAPAGIDCGADCAETYPNGTQVILAANPAAGSVFAGWSGGGCAGTGVCTVTMDGARTVTATFDGPPPAAPPATPPGPAPTFTLAVAKAGSGAGTVASVPAGVDCGEDCAEGYPAGATVTLTATPAARSTFVGFAGACTGTGPCTVAMDAARTVLATFEIQRFTLTVVKAGSGGGMVTSTPAGIQCVGDCAETYLAGTVVTLTPRPAINALFVGWSGGGCVGTAPCAVTMDEAKTVTATFTRPSCFGRPATIAGRGVITGTQSPDVLVGGDGPDVIYGRGGNDLICGGGGNDRLLGGPGNDRLDGEAGHDVLDGGPGNDELRGGVGNDILAGGEGNDTLSGGAGNDVGRGGNGADRLDGGPGLDRLFGEGGDDRLDGGPGPGRDVCSGGPGTDTTTPACEVKDPTP